MSNNWQHTYQILCSTYRIVCSSIECAIRFCYYLALPKVFPGKTEMNILSHKVYMSIHRLGLHLLVLGLTWYTLVFLVFQNI